MEVPEIEAGMLDAVLETLASNETLDRTQLLELFDGDEELATSITNTLVEANLVIRSGAITESGLPEKILRTDAIAPFLNDGGFTAKVPKPQAPVSKQAEPSREVVFEIENKLPEEEVTAPDPEPIPEPERPATDELLNQEIAQLHFEQRKFEHRLREKDILIETLSAQNATLSRFRVFIWVLLGVIALLATALIAARLIPGSGSLR